ncbi:MAG: prolipoprotein diacylglyceryl transferase [Dehalococcoidia bacterium]
MEALSAPVLLAIKIGIDPEIFKIAGLEITWHGLFTALGVVVGVLMAAILARRAGIPDDTIYNAALALVIGGIIGARALYVLEHLDNFRDHPLDVFDIQAGGISIYGALIGGTLGAAAYAAWRRLPRWGTMADVAAIGAILGMAVGRIGCLIDGDIFARTTDWPIGIVYTHSDSPSYPIYTAGPTELAQHPVTAYEIVGDLIIFVLLLFVLRRVFKRDGMIFFAWAFLYSAMRFGISFLRGTDIDGQWVGDDLVIGGLRSAQLIALAIMVATPLAVAYILNRHAPARAVRRRLTRAERRRLAQEEADKG